jgi:glycine/D-amino acid oxidase-like deaminating enzyme/nitrite reductase/ring-hydroxylating ferredoxin subunit
MKERDSSTESLWQNVQLTGHTAASIPSEAPYDVLIIGGGITGITTAMLLQQAGKKCIVAEGRNLGFGTTGGTTAHLNTFFDATYPEIEKDFGKEAARLIADAGKESINMIKEFIDTYGIACDFEEKDAFLFSENEKETKQLIEILEATRNAGVNAVEDRENHVPLPFEMVIQITDQAQFHPLKYLNQLAAAFVNAGGVISENTFIKNTRFEDGVHIAESDKLTITATNLVYATHMPPGINILDFRCAPYRSYVVGITLQNNDYPDALVYDMQEPYHYFRTHEIDGQKYLILGGEDHKTGHDDPEKAFSNLIDYAKKYYYVKDIAFQWSAQYYVPADGLPYIGPLPGGPDNLYVATGYNGNGMIFGTLAGRIIADQILGTPNPYEELLSPSRIKPIAGFQEFVTENADVAYRFIADRISVKEIDSFKEIQPGSGQVIKYKSGKLAVYKDDNGKITALDPTCTHAKCIVNFNAVEKSWDCPCHGGRFNLAGEVLSGPPRKNLNPIQTDEI